jgi:hypothetical protein
VSKGRSATFRVQPLPDAPAATPTPPEPTAEEVAACVEVDELRAMWKRATTDDLRALITQRKEDLENEPERDATTDRP